MVEAWLMDSSSEDQRLPHRRSPNVSVSLEQLQELGVIYRYALSILIVKGCYLSASCASDHVCAAQEGQHGQLAVRDREFFEGIQLQDLR
jgi:hypothetical protein